MIIQIAVELSYQLPQVSDVLLQIEAPALADQRIVSASIRVPDCEHFSRVPALDLVGERIWLRTGGLLSVDYQSTMAIERDVIDYRHCHAVAPHRLPGESIAYLMPSRYCESDKFHSFCESEFGGFTGGARIGAMRDWIAARFRYRSGVSQSNTTSLDTFVRREGVCRDFAHVLIALARASGMPARFVSVYAPDVMPPDFHAVCEIFLSDGNGGGMWHLVDPTGMSHAGDIVRIAVGRDAADVAFLTTFSDCDFVSQSVSVLRIEEASTPLAA